MIGEGLRPGPPPRQRVYHFGAKVRCDGAMSALCYRRPRPINLRLALWTIREEAVTCPKCKAILAATPGQLAWEGQPSRLTLGRAEWREGVRRRVSYAEVGPRGDGRWQWAARIGALCATGTADTACAAKAEAKSFVEGRIGGAG